MKRLVVVLLISLCLASSGIGADGIDKVYQKPANCRTWGQLFADYFSYSGYTKSYAIVIGISTYDSYDTLPTKNDSIPVRDFLLDVAGFDYVHLLTEDRETLDRICDLMVDKFPRLINRNNRFSVVLYRINWTESLKLPAIGLFNELNF